MANTSYTSSQNNRSSDDNRKKIAAQDTALSGEIARAQNVENKIRNNAGEYIQSMVDSTLSYSSKMPVQNKVITTTINGKASASMQLAEVGYTGSYTDISNKPTIPPQQYLDRVISGTSENAVMGGAVSRELPYRVTRGAYRTVATTGSYNDLTDKPVIGSFQSYYWYGKPYAATWSGKAYSYQQQESTSSATVTMNLTVEIFNVVKPNSMERIEFGVKGTVRVQGGVGSLNDTININHARSSLGAGTGVTIAQKNYEYGTYNEENWKIIVSLNTSGYLSVDAYVYYEDYYTYKSKREHALYQKFNSLEDAKVYISKSVSQFPSNNENIFTTSHGTNIRIEQRKNRVSTLDAKVPLIRGQMSTIRATVGDVSVGHQQPSIILPSKACYLGNEVWYVKDNFSAITNYYTSLINDSYWLISIGKNAFAGCTSMTSVSQQNAAQHVNQRTYDVLDRAFAGCTKLVSFSDNNAILSGKSIFAGDIKLETVSAGRCTVIGESAFEGCSSLDAVHVNSQSLELKRGAFVGTNMDYSALDNNDNGILTKSANALVGMSFQSPGETITIPSKISIRTSGTIRQSSVEETGDVIPVGPLTCSELNQSDRISHVVITATDISSTYYQKKYDFKSQEYDKVETTIRSTCSFLGDTISSFYAYWGSELAGYSWNAGHWKIIVHHPYLYEATFPSPYIISEPGPSQTPGATLYSYTSQNFIVNKTPNIGICDVTTATTIGSNAFMNARISELNLEDATTIQANAFSGANIENLVVFGRCSIGTLGTGVTKLTLKAYTVAEADTFKSNFGLASGTPIVCSNGTVYVP